MTSRTFALAAASGLVAALFGAAASAQEAATVAFLMPDQASTRYEEHDFPGFQKSMGELCADCTVIYQNANGDVALQQQQFNSASSTVRSTPWTCTVTPEAGTVPVCARISPATVETSILPSGKP